MFFRNLILGTDYELKNRYMHVDYVPKQSDNIVRRRKWQIELENQNEPLRIKSLH